MTCKNSNLFTRVSSKAIKYTFWYFLFYLSNSTPLTFAGTITRYIWLYLDLHRAEHIEEEPEGWLEEPWLTDQQLIWRGWHLVSQYWNVLSENFSSRFCSAVQQTTAFLKKINIKILKYNKIEINKCFKEVRKCLCVYLFSIYIYYLFIYFQRIVIIARDLLLMELQTMCKQCRISIVNSRFMCDCQLDF